MNSCGLIRSPSDLRLTDPDNRCPFILFPIVAERYALMLLLSVQLLPLITTGPDDSHPSAERARTLRTIEFDALK